jgi:transglutaminase-like putative cysteine protease
MANHRRTAVTAVAVLLASLSLYPIFIGGSWFWAGFGAVLVVALAGTATRLRRLPVLVTVLAGVVALLLYLNLVFSNTRSLYHLLPTPASLAALWHIAGQGFTESAKYAPPVPELRGMVLLAAAGVGITALLTDLIAVRLGSAALAGLPLLLLFTEPFTLSVSRGFLGTALAFCAGVAGYLMLLSSEARDRIREWEYPDAAERDEPDVRPLAAAGRRVGFASVAIALCLPLFIPGLHVTRLFGGQPGIGGNGGHGGAVVGFPDPITQLSQDLHEGQVSTVLTYSTTANQPDYLQVYTLDKLTDSGWKPFAQPESLVPVSPQLPPPPGLSEPASLTGATTVSTAVNIEPGVTDLWSALPAPYPVRTAQLNPPGSSLRAEHATLMLVDQGAPISGLKYTLTSLSEDPSPAVLGDAPAADISAAYRYVPASYQSLLPFAESVVHNAKNPEQEAVALQDYLADGDFTYTLNAPGVVNAATLKNFLTAKKGWCLQFSFAMGVLARLLGIPARIAYGFTAGTKTGNTWVVTNYDAHAWPELYFQGYGWLRFEPTPAGAGIGQGGANPPGYTLRAGNAAPATGSQTATSPAGATPAGGAASQQNKAKQQQQQLIGGAESGGAAGGGGPNPWAVLGLVLAGLVVLAAIAPWSARRLIRRRRWGYGRRARADRAGARDIAQAHAAWQELRDDLMDYGAGYQPSESPRAVARRAAGRLSLAEPARAALGRIAMAEERARYAPAPADGARLPADSAVVRRAIAAAVPRRARWRAWLLPSSVLRPALGRVTSAADWSRGLTGERLARGNRRRRAQPGQPGPGQPGQPEPGRPVKERV